MPKGASHWVKELKCKGVSTTFINININFRSVLTQQYGCSSAHGNDLVPGHHVGHAEWYGLQLVDQALLLKLGLRAKLYSLLGPGIEVAIGPHSHPPLVDEEGLRGDHLAHGGCHCCQSVALEGWDGRVSNHRANQLRALLHVELGFPNPAVRPLVYS